MCLTIGKTVQLPLRFTAPNRACRPYPATIAEPIKSDPGGGLIPRPDLTKFDRGDLIWLTES